MLSLALTTQASDKMPFETWDATTLDVHGEIKSLNGEWDFLPSDDLNRAPNFNNAQKVLLPRRNLTGSFGREFVVNSDPGTKRVILHFDAVAFRCVVYINGKRIGEHAGGMTPFEFDVTEHVQKGKNKLAIVVQGRKGANLDAKSTGEAASITYNERSAPSSSGGVKTAFGVGYFALEGIRQSISIREVPLFRIADVTINTSYRTKEITARVNILNQATEAIASAIQLDILPYEVATKEVGKAPVWGAKKEIISQESESTESVKRAWPDPKLWMPGDPHLYVARIRLMDQTGNVLDERNVRFGFREVWINGNQIIVNGKPFRAFAHGTLDTEASPEVNRALFRKIMDIGINVIRPHTMPPPPHFTQLADEMGMGIIGEGEVTFNMNYAFDEPIFWKHFERLWRERIARDKNHPSILYWSLANEVILCSPNETIGKHFHDAYTRLRAIDPTRVFMQEGDGDLRDQKPDSRGFPIDVINLHLYDVSPTKNPLWATEFPPVAWTLEEVEDIRNVPGSLRYGAGMLDRNRPWFIGEFGPAVGIASPDFFGFWTGPTVYRDLFGQAKALVRGVGETVTIQLQAFRDLGMAGMTPWDLPEKPQFAPYLKRGLEPVTVFPRGSLSHWESGAGAKRRIVVLNDSFSTEELTLNLVVKDGENPVAQRETAFLLQPGEKKVEEWCVPVPKVDQKTSLQVAAELTDQNGKRLSGFDETWVVYPEISPSPTWKDPKIWLCGEAKNLAAIAEWTGARFHPTSDLKEITPSGVKLLMIDQSVLDTLGQGFEKTLERYIEQGGMVVAMGVDSLSLGGLKIEANPDSDSTRLFRLRNSPLTNGTKDIDWEFWHPDHYVSRGNYTMSFDPAFEFPLVGGGRNGPMYSPLAILKHGRGVLIASRLQINQAVNEEPVARIFLNNLANYLTDLEKAVPEQEEHKLTVFCPEEKRAEWEQRLAKARISMSGESTEMPGPAHGVVLLTGDAAPSPGKLDEIEEFLQRGGTLWLHRLTPDTTYLNRVEAWLGSPLSLRKPKMWLQQLELVTPQNPHSFLEGINDSHTCWATFAWTNGNAYSVRTTTIADWVLEGKDSIALLREPEWIGKWNVTTMDDGVLSQKILRSLGTHESNESPAAGLAVQAVGRGRVIIDQVRWDHVLNEPESESCNKALYFGGTLWKNLSRR